MWYNDNTWCFVWITLNDKVLILYFNPLWSLSLYIFCSSKAHTSDLPEVEKQTQHVKNKTVWIKENFSSSLLQIPSDICESFAIGRDRFVLVKTTNMRKMVRENHLKWQILRVCDVIDHVLSSHGFPLVYIYLMATVIRFFSLAQGLYDFKRAAKLATRRHCFTVELNRWNRHFYSSWTLFLYFPFVTSPHFS